MKTSYIAVITATLLAVSTGLHAEQTCRTDIQKSAPDSRYKIWGDGSEVLDYQTGLIWQRCLLGQTWNGSDCLGTATRHNFADALSKAKTINQHYRLPNIKELYSLIEVACHEPTINNTIFLNAFNRELWSSTPAWSDTQIRTLVFDSWGDTYSRNATKTGTYYIRAVRSAQ